MGYGICVNCGRVKECKRIGYDPINNFKQKSTYDYCKCSPKLSRNHTLHLFTEVSKKYARKYFKENPKELSKNG